MERKKPSFVMHITMWPAIREMTDENIGKLFRAIMEYNADGVLPDGLDPQLKMAFEFFKARFDADYDKWIERCEINKEIARNRGKKDKNNES